MVVVVVVVGSIIVWSRCMAIGVKISNHHSHISPIKRARSIYDIICPFDPDFNVEFCG